MNLLFAVLIIPVVKLVNFVLTNLLRFLVLICSIGFACIVIYILNLVFFHLHIPNLISTYISNLSKSLLSILLSI
jgi:hypothetical protein